MRRLDLICLLWFSLEETSHKTYHRHLRMHARNSVVFYVEAQMFGSVVIHANCRLGWYGGISLVTTGSSRLTMVIRSWDAV